MKNEENFFVIYEDICDIVWWGECPHCTYHYQFKTIKEFKDGEIFKCRFCKKESIIKIPAKN